MIFLGTQPTLTQVPPKACFSIKPTDTPNSAALRAEAMPPDPPPMTKYWKCLAIFSGAILDYFLRATLSLLSNVTNVPYEFGILKNIKILVKMTGVLHNFYLIANKI